MSTSARRDELLYESDAALRLVDRAIQEMCVSEEDQETLDDGVSVAAGVDPAASQELDSAD